MRWTRSDVAKIRRIATAWYLHTRRLSRAAQRIQSKWRIYTTIDPITLQRITGADFLLCRCDRLHRYDAHTLASYIRTSGDFDDPIARIEYQTHELMRLDRLTNLGAKKERLVDLRDDLMGRRREDILVESISVALERELSATISLACEIPNAMDSQLRDDVIPLLVQCYDNLRTIDEPRSRFLIRSMYYQIRNNSMEWRSVQVRDNVLAMLYVFMLYA